jgi:hypothetical protein
VDVADLDRGVATDLCDSPVEMRNFAGGLPWPLGEVTLVHNMDTSAQSADRSVQAEAQADRQGRGTRNERSDAADFRSGARLVGGFIRSV